MPFARCAARRTVTGVGLDLRSFWQVIVMEANEPDPQTGHDHEPRTLHDHAATPRASAFLCGGVGLGAGLVIVLLTHGFGLLSRGTSSEEAPTLVHRGERI